MIQFRRCLGRVNGQLFRFLRYVIVIPPLVDVYAPQVLTHFCFSTSSVCTVKNIFANSTATAAFLVERNCVRQYATHQAFHWVKSLVLVTILQESFTSICFNFFLASFSLFPTYSLQHFSNLSKNSFISSSPIPTAHAAVMYECGYRSYELPNP